MKIRKVLVEFIIETEVNADYLEGYIKEVIKKEIPRAERIDIRVY